jgi:hypothetical protein
MSWNASGIGVAFVSVMADIVSFPRILFFTAEVYALCRDEEHAAKTIILHEVSHDGGSIYELKKKNLFGARFANPSAASGSLSSDTRIVRMNRGITMGKQQIISPRMNRCEPISNQHGQSISPTT